MLRIGASSTFLGDGWIAPAVYSDTAYKTGRIRHVGLTYQNKPVINAYLQKGISIPLSLIGR